MRGTASRGGRLALHTTTRVRSQRMATNQLVTVVAAALFLVGLVFLAPPGLLRPARHAFTPRNTHYSWVIKGAPLPGETADAASFGGGGFQYMHMAMMERLPNGTLAVAFQASPTSYEGSVHQALFWSTSSDGGDTWSSPAVLMDDDQMPVWTPVLRAEGKRLWLIYTRSSRRCRYFDRSRGVLRHSPGGDLLYVASDDSGLTWSSPQVSKEREASFFFPLVENNWKKNPHTNTTSQRTFLLTRPHRSPVPRPRPRPDPNHTHPTTFSR